MHFDYGVVDVSLQCEGAECAGTTPFLLTAGFDYSLGAFARRPCTEPPTCLPAVDAILTGSSLSALATSITLSAEASFSSQGGIKLLDGANKVSSAFYQPTAPLLQGFTTTFNFEVTASCSEGSFCSSFGIGCCSDLGGGFAFVIQADSPAPVGTTCNAVVRTKMPRCAARL
eukprot:4208882-Prymnesium_polylepis.2